jgi:uncharacterized membrane protein YjfL (UPF0719 family)
MKRFLSLCSAAIVAFSASPALAATKELTGQPVLDDVLFTVMYSAIGIVMAFVGYKCIDLLTPGDLGKDIADNNIALAVLTGLTMLGICLIIASVLAS